MSSQPPGKLDFTHELEVASQLAVAAGKLIMAVYATPFAVEYKDSPTVYNDAGVNMRDAALLSPDPVTLADKQANALIVAGLRRAFPEDGILAEELPETPADIAHRQACSRLWCVDPLDGTREFVRRSGDFIVMIGLAVQGRAVAGVLYQPTTQRLYSGSGNRAFVQDVAGKRALRVSNSSDPSAAVLVVSRGHSGRVVEQVAAHLGSRQLLPVGSVGLKIARLCEAQADLYVSASNKTHQWDACAPEAILQAAGGVFTDVFGQPQQYNRRETRTPHGLVGSNGQLHAGLFKRFENLPAQPQLNYINASVQ